MDWKRLGLNTLQAFIADLALGSIGAKLKSLPPQRIEQFFVRFGKAFGPPQVRHFSELTPVEKEALLNRVPVLRKNHEDWPKAFSWIPRTVTTWVGPAPQLSDVIVGSEPLELKPIPNRGQWYVLRGYMAATTMDGIHDRIGWRFDDVDLYWTLSFTVKFY